MKVSVVVPVFNEEGNIELLYRRLTEVFSKIGCEFDVWFVNDGSYDRSGEVLQGLRERESRVQVLTFARNFGHQLALTAGIDHAEGDVVISMDSDLQHPPELIPELIEEWKKGNSIVYTVRMGTDNEGILKRLTSRCFYSVFRRLTGVDLPAGAADFRLFDRQVVRAFRSLRERTRFLRGLTFWVGFKSVGIPYVAPKRHSGRSKYGLSRMVWLALDGITAFSAKPLYLAIVVGLVFMGFGGLYLLYAVMVFFFFPLVVVPGWTSLVSVVVLVGGVQLLVTGLASLYIGKIYEEVKQRPLYILKDG